jgi:hypothetical protein
VPADHQLRGIDWHLSLDEIRRKSTRKLFDDSEIARETAETGMTNGNFWALVPEKYSTLIDTARLSAPIIITPAHCSH